jgi:hypothetical protein
MEGFTLDDAATPVVLRSKARDGTVSEYHFEVVSLTKPVLDAYEVHEKKLRSLQQRIEKKGAESPGDKLEMFSLVALALDERVTSTNGPVTITSLWDDGRIGVSQLLGLMAKVQEDATRPPA